MQYAGFWRRFGAMWVDFLVMLPLLAFTVYFGNKYRLFHLYWLVPGVLIGLWFSVYLVFRYGGTPGKLVLKTKILMADGTAVTAKAAVLRHIVLLLLAIGASIGFAMAALQLTDAQYASLGFRERALALEALAPSWHRGLTISMNIWIWSEFLTMLFNKRRRAIHDLMAGTVVVRTT